MKIDFKKKLKEFYAPAKKGISLVDVPAMNFIAIDGKGDPEGPQFAEAIQALYPISYGIKFSYKKATGTDYGVMPLEGLWWADDMEAFQIKTQDKKAWKWTIMIMQPEFITKEMFDQAKDAAEKKKPNPLYSKVRFEKFTEGKSAQVMHIGPYSQEEQDILAIHNKIAELGGERSGKHHEIYLSDMRKASPDKLKTILRQGYKI